MNRGKLIVFEGLDGSGKTTQMELLSDVMNKNGRHVITTHEPSENAVGKLVRSAIQGETTFDPQTILLLFAADRIEHITKFIIPELEIGNDVLCDRFYLSNFAYQAEAADLEQIISYNRYSMEMLRPDITFYLDLSPDECIDRININRVQAELYENKEMLTKVSKNYFRAINRLENEEKIVTVNASEPIENVLVKVWEHIKEIL